MNSKIHRRLRDLRTTSRHIVPDAAWVRATRETLRTRVARDLPESHEITILERVRAAFHAFAPRKFGVWLRRPAIAFALIVLVLAGGSVVSVSAAEHALPGDFLYSVKLATEQARLAFTPVKEEQLKLKTEFTSRRVRDLKLVASDRAHPDRVVQAAEILKQDLNTLKQQLRDVAQSASVDTTAAAAKLVDQKSTDVINALQQTKTQLAPEGKEKLTEAQSAAADTGMKAIEILAATQQQSKGSVPVVDVTQAIKDHAQAVSDVGDSVSVDAGLLTTSSTMVTSSTQVLAEIASSSTLSTSRSTFSTLIGRMTHATQQIFAQQKAIDQLQISEASGTESIPEKSVLLGSSDNEAASSTANEATSSTATDSTSTSLSSTSTATSSTATDSTSTSLSSTSTATSGTTKAGSSTETKIPL